jgi:hypothetical protein
MKTLQEIEKAIETLQLPNRLRLYKDMPLLIGRAVEDLDWTIKVHLLMSKFQPRVGSMEALPCRMFN